MKTSIPRSIRVILTLLCGVALLLLAAPARAQIALVDNELNGSSTILNADSGTAYLALATNLTVSAAANTLVVEVSARNNSVTAPNWPSTLSWTNATATNTLTLAVSKFSQSGSGGRDALIYYCYNPSSGSGFNIKGTGSITNASGTLVAYTLSGVNTTVSPLTNSGSSQAASPISFAISSITGNSWAAVDADIATQTGTQTVTATNGSAATGKPVLTTISFAHTSTASLGYISAILFGGSDTFTYTYTTSGGNQSFAAAVFTPLNLNYLGIDQQPQSVTIPAGQSLNATFTLSANGNPAITSYQWYEIGGGVTNLLTGANTASFTTNSPTVNDSFFVVVGNGSTTVTSSVVTLTLYTSGTWNTSSGSWNTPGNWVGNTTASGVDATASFVNGLGGTVTLDSAAGFTVGTNIFGVTGATTVQTPWVISSGLPAGTLTLADDTTVPTSVVSGGTAPSVTSVPVITVYSNNPVTINAPLAGNQGLFVNGGGTLVLSGGNTNNTYSGTTVIGANNADTTALQIGTGGTSGAIDFINNIFLSGYGQLIFNRSDTITVSNIIRCQAGKAPNVIVNSGTVIMAPPANINLFMGAVVNSGGTLVMKCPANVDVVANTGGTVNITNGTPNTSTTGANGGNSGGISLGINSGGLVQLAGPGGNGVNIQANNGVLDNGTFDLGGDAVQIGVIAGAGIVTNTGATLATLNLSGTIINVAYPWSGTIADGTTAQTAVTLSGGTTIFAGPNTYTGSTILAGGILILTNSASLASANISVSGANLILANAATIANPHATISVGSGRTLDLTGLAGNFGLNAGQTLVVTNTGIVSAGANTVTAASGSTLVPGGNGTAGTMTINANLTLNGNTNAFDLATAATEGVGNDEIVGVTNLTLSGNITIRVNTGFNNTFNPATSYKLIKYSGTLANTANFTVIPSTLSGNSVMIDTVSLPGYVLLTTGGSSPPSLSISPTNIDAFTGYPVTLPVTESGSTPITNQWYNGATAVPGATSASYTFTPVIPGVYTYTLQATNAYGHTNAVVTVHVGSPAISIQCTILNQSYAFYLSSTDTAGVYGVSNWNVFAIVPNGAGRISTTETGISMTNPVDSNGFATPATFSAVGVNDGYHEVLTITSSDTANARMMNTYWYANPISTTPASTNITFTVTNLPNDTYDVYVYMLTQVSTGTKGNVEVYDSIYTNYVEYGEVFSSTSNFVTAVNTTGTGVLPYANYVKLRISTGGTNSISFTESGTGNGVGGAGVCGVQIVPVPPSPPTITQQPLSQRVVTNTLATFTVQANGFPLAYQWFSISTGAVTNLIASATNASYTTPPVQDTDTGTGFFVVVSNMLNQVQSSTAILTAGHMVTASGLLEDDQFYLTGLNLADTFIDIYPDSAWLVTTQPNNIEYLNTLDVINDLAIEPPPYISEAERIYGWFTPAVSGDYVFFVASDDAGALYLSTNNAPTNSYLVAQNQADMAAQDWTCSNTGTPEYTTYFSSDEFRSDLFIAPSGNDGTGALNQYNPGGWVATPNYNSGDGGITLVAGTPYYIELDNYYGGANNQNAAVTYKLAGQPDPASGSASLMTGSNISASVPDSVLPVSQPTITKIVVSGSNVILTGSNGLLNAAYYVLSTTNLTTPLANWTVSPLHVFDVNGNFINTNAVGAQATFYRLYAP
jgi:autotransporter-associated beta strand protein